MELTVRVKRMMEKYDMEAEDVVYADLMHSGWGKVEGAYFAYHLSYFEANKINQWLRDKTRLVPGIMKMLSDLEAEDAEERKKLRAAEEKAKNKQTQLEKEAKKNKEVTEESLRTKQGMLEYLIELAATPGLDLRTKADLAKQITDLQNYKKEEIKEEDTRIHFYLPLTCAKCELYKNHKQRKKEDNTNESESTQGNGNKTD